MLILYIPLDKCIHIGDEVTVKVVKVTHTLVKVGVEAPAEVSIKRQELLDEHT